MTGYATKPWSDRFGVMGVQAEAALERWAACRDVTIQRFGFDRSPLPREAMLQLPLFVRHAPDYILHEEGWTYFVDCVGTANRAGFRVRSTKLQALEFYAKQGCDPLLFVYLSPSDEYAFVPHAVAQATKGPADHFSDGNVFHPVPVTTPWVGVPR